MKLLTTEHAGDGRAIELGGVVFTTAISGANVLRDVREAITNTIGGQMTRYETLVEQTVERALSSLGKKAEAQGYDGVLGIRLSHPVITDGAVEIVAMGTGFRYRA